MVTLKRSKVLKTGESNTLLVLLNIGVLNNARNMKVVQTNDQDLYELTPKAFMIVAHASLVLNILLVLYIMWLNRI